MRPTSIARLSAHVHYAIRILLLTAAASLLGACGFHLKGATPLPFDTLYTNIPENSSFGAYLRRSLLASSPNTRFTDDIKEAQARLIQLSLEQSMREISLSPEGQVEDYELRLQFTFQLTNERGQTVLPPTTLTRLREIPYDSSALQATQGEISTLFIGMQQSLVDQIVRRLTSTAVHDAYMTSQHTPGLFNSSDASDFDLDNADTLEPDDPLPDSRFGTGFPGLP